MRDQPVGCAKKWGDSYPCSVTTAMTRDLCLVRPTYFVDINSIHLSLNNVTVYLLLKTMLFGL